MSEQDPQYELTLSQPEMNFLYQLLDNVQVRGVETVRVLNTLVEKFWKEGYELPLPDSDVVQE